MSKVVFVGNVPYNTGEQALIDVFKSVGQVIGFRLLFDRDTGKPKGYGFCEFADHETAASAVRNLNNTDVGGRPLRIHLADSDPFLEGKTTVRGELMDSTTPGPSEPPLQWRTTENRGPEKSTILATIPLGKPLGSGEQAQAVITNFIGRGMSEKQLIEVLAQMKAFVITYPKQAHAFLSNHPQVAYAVFMGLFTSKILPADILNRMLNANQHSNLQRVPPQQPVHNTMPPPQPVHETMPSPMGVVHPGIMFSHPIQPTPPSMSPYYRPNLQGPQPPYPPPQEQPQHPSNFLPLLQMLRNGGKNLNAQALYSIVLNLTPAQIDNLPTTDRTIIESLRNELLSNRGGVGA
ncbi:hypothetical protein B0H13DRAFT_2377533 [Mycena leptocephala]|nr:hypothetical protein B0H13DRAFT_2377533 [Mycena leptocephala]